jgi:hypothetical protein
MERATAAATGGAPSPQAQAAQGFGARALPPPPARSPLSPPARPLRATATIVGPKAAARQVRQGR